MFDIKVSELKHGDYLTPESLEEAFGEKRGTDAYALKQLKLRGYIESESASDGTPLFVKGERYGLRVMSNNEADDYFFQRWDGAVGMMRTLRKKHATIDVSDLDSEERVTHANRQCVMAHVEQATIGEYRKQVNRLGPPKSDGNLSLGEKVE